MTTTTIRLEDPIKKKAQKLAKSIGFSFSDLINTLLKKAIREGGIDLRNAQPTENGFSPDFEESVISADKPGDYESFDSVDDMIQSAFKK